jgi:hypothetical protein
MKGVYDDMSMPDLRLSADVGMDTRSDLPPSDAGAPSDAKLPNDSQAPKDVGE